MRNQGNLFGLNTPGSVSLVVVILMHAVFFIYAYKHNNIYLADDSNEYLWQAYNLKHHGSWYASDYEKAYDPYLQTRRPPLYGIFIFLAKSIYNSDFFVCLLQNIMSTWSLMMAASIAKRFIKNISWFVIPALLFLFPTQLVYANRIMADVLFQFLLVLSAWFLVKFFESEKNRNLFWVSLLIGLAMITKPVLYLFTPLFILFFLWLWRRKTIQSLRISYSFIPLVFALSLSFYNQKQTGYFHFSSGNNMLVYHYYSTSARFGGEENELAKSDSITSLAKENAADLKEFSSNMQHSFFNIMKENPYRFTLLQLNGMLQFFTDHGRWDIESFFVTPVYTQTKGWRNAWRESGIKGVFDYMSSFGILKLLYLATITMVNIFTTIIFCRFLCNGAIDQRFRFFLLLLSIYLVFVTGFVGCSRYKMAIFPFILVATVHYFSKRDSEEKALQ